MYSFLGSFVEKVHTLDLDAAVACGYALIYLYFSICSLTWKMSCRQLNTLYVSKYPILTSLKMSEFVYPIMNSMSPPAHWKLNMYNTKFQAFLFQTCSNHTFQFFQSLSPNTWVSFSTLLFLTSTFCYSHTHISNPVILAFEICSESIASLRIHDNYPVLSRHPVSHTLSHFVFQSYCFHPVLYTKNQNYSKNRN